jgi:putative ABC transport system permease protein
MLIFRLISKSIWYFRKPYLAVFAGTVIATATLTGALIIGDSLKHSLGRLVDVRLGRTEYAFISASRFVRAQLANDLASALHTPVTPLLLLRGIAIHPGTGERLNMAQVVGIDSGFWAFSPSGMPFVNPGEALLSPNTAQRLNLKKGDQFILRVEKAGLIPVNSIFSPENGTSVALRLTVTGITGDSTLGRFSFRNNQSAPYNIFISRQFLAKQLQLEALANVIIIAAGKQGNVEEAMVSSAFQSCWRLQDASLRIARIGKSGSYDLNSSRVFVDDKTAMVISGLKVPHTSILTYLVNCIHFRQKQTPYSFVTAVSSSQVFKNPGENGVIINRWLADDLGAKTGDTISMDYFVIGPLRTLSERSNKFVIRGIIPADSGISAKSLMPAFPGLSDAGSCRDWNSGVPINLKLIRDKDEKYWKEYKGSPKAYISLKAGQALWNNQFGNCTAIRYNDTDISSDSLQNILMQELNPRDIGIELVSVRRTGKNAAANSVDFGSLFLYLSFFIIAGSLLLTILIYALNTETRMHESALLAGLGFDRKRIIRLRLMESVPIALAGGLAGALSGIVFSYALLAGLNGLWQDAVHTNMLDIQIRPVTLTAGATAGIILALVSVWWVARHKLKNPVSGLIRDYPGNVPASSFYRHSLPGFISITCIGASLLLVVFSVVSSAFQNAILFLAAGALFLSGSISFFAFFLGKSKESEKYSLNILRLALKNVERNRTRSLAVVVILALGVFTVILTGANRRTFFGTGNLVKSGTGGYQQWVESNLPVPFDLNSTDGRKRLILENDNDLDHVHFLQFQSLEGDDASCLNLNQVQKPRILGVPVNEFAGRGAFSFTKLMKGIDRDNPWKELDKTYGDNVYPAFADQTVIQYGLGKSVGDTLTYVNEKGRTLRFVLAGGLDNSVFQGSLLVSERVMLEQFPSGGGSKVILVDAPSSKQDLVSGILRNSLPDYGIEVTSTSARLAEFNSVENTYLTVFMMLGGLGLLIGTLGLGIVLLRNMLERRHELALLVAIGYRKDMLMRLIFYEHAFLQLAGVACGTISAFFGIMPSLVTPVFTFQPGFISLMILMILFSGFLWIYLSIRHIMRQNLLVALKEE